MKTWFVGLLVVVGLASVSLDTQAEVVGSFSLSPGWLLLNLSDLSNSLEQHSYPELSDSLFTLGIDLSFGFSEFMRLGLAGYVSQGLPLNHERQSREIDFTFLYGGLFAEFTLALPIKISVGSVFGAGGAILTLSQNNSESLSLPDSFDDALSGKLSPVESTFDITRSYWVARPNLTLALPISISPESETKIAIGMSFSYLYAFPMGNWAVGDSKQNKNWPGPLDHLNGLAVTIAFNINGVIPAYPALSFKFIRYRGEDEVVSIGNDGRKEVNLSGWQLISSAGASGKIAEVFVFPQGCLLPAGGEVRIHSGPAVAGKSNTPCSQAEIDLYGRYAGTDSDTAEVWNDQADMAQLQNARGYLIARCSYDEKSSELGATECRD
ncbi:lamin tail domain-containing protein [Candidatus Acetothermia bacterium]|nr:lamin tail domain-containing protein [Candidatus Acetothermia bacterium]